MWPTNHDVWLQKVYKLALAYKDLEALQKSPDTRWKPAGTPNLYAVARGNGSVTWIARVAIDGKRQNITIGKWPNVTANEARDITPAIKSMLKGGYNSEAVKNALSLTLDPIQFSSLVRAEKVSASGQTPTFEEVATHWYETHLRDGLSDGPYKKQVIQQLRDHVFPKLGRRQINEIKQKEIREALSDIWVNHEPSGKKIRSNIERIFELAVADELVEYNPTPSPRLMPKSRHFVQHMAHLPHERAPEFWQWLMSRPRMSLQTRTGIAMALLLAKRSQEIRFIEWSHIDFDNAVWTTPASRMKMRKEHRQPLTEPILSMLHDLKRLTSNQKFALGVADKPISENAMLVAVKRFDEITIHGFRATCGTWCEENGIDQQVSKIIKAHQPKYLDAAYQRSDLLEQRLEALQRWADYVTG
ncbi:tyrosine-type recombinase/integrase [Roseobacter sp. HKCCD7870]|uniref:tyrosine-type recombinase/integrase n=1 Tax=Roseobacter sp. HKCCD7870 TaxID=3120343 RepID=UPI0030EC0323